MYTKALHRQPQRLLSCRYSNLRFCSSSATLKRSCRGAYQSIRYPSSSHYHNVRSSSLTWPAVDIITDRHQSQIYQPAYNHESRQFSTNPAATSLSLADLEYRVAELEQRTHRLTNLDVQHELWPLLANCAVSSSSQYRSPSSKVYNLQEQAISRAKLSSRILDLCLKEVEDRRVLLWDWLQTTATNDIDDKNNGNRNEMTDNQNFSPTKFWNEAPHPTRQMFNLVLSSWKTVITSSSQQQHYSNNSQQQTSIQLIEQAATQASTLLHQMEEEYSSDTAFIQEYNTRIDKGRYTTLLVGAAQPDVRNYSEVIGCWGACIDGGGVVRDGKRKGKGRRDRDNNHHVRDGVLQQRLRLEACAMKAMMELLESMEEDLYGAFSNSDESDMTTSATMRQKKPPPDRVCYNIILASMARQLNPSLYEMRLVLQRMMERVQYELESERDDNEEEDDGNFSYAMSFFPDIFSYNALIEARANRAAMFTSETSSDMQQQQRRQQQQRQQLQSRWRQQLTNKVAKPMKSRFTSSEEEAILAEQMLEEINHISTVSIRPNIWSYNGESLCECLQICIRCVLISF